MKPRWIPVAAAAAAVVTVAPIAFAAGSARTGALALKADFSVNSQPGSCPAGSAADLCAAREGRAVIPGLGNVLESYSYPVLQEPPGCPVDSRRILPYTVRFTVAGKGDIFLAVPGSAEACLPEGTAKGQSLGPTYGPIAVTGGSGVYAGASGTFTLEHHLNFSAAGASGTDAWAGTLAVPGLEFDLTPPTMSGAVDKTVRAPKHAKRVRVKYAVTAQDDVDGAVPASCEPKSESRFKVGRTTTVKCSATDSSANTATATFRVTVKRGR